MDSIVDPHPLRAVVADGVSGRVDPARTRQIVVNLIANAATVSPDREPIEVTVRRRRNEVEIAVRDHGPGFPPARSEDLFRKYSRVHASTTSLGLGLYVARGLARAHGGELTA
ncbi:MAG: sensor histidine kinase, partial [Actinomycetota bacterium]|nr:sensor histidine kinase [Actinomycetota bacterium]